MAGNVIRDVIKEIEVVHKETFVDLNSGDMRFARIVVWANTETGKRVWLRTVEGGLDSLFIEIKVAMAQEFFKGLAGCEIAFHPEDEVKDKENPIFFAERYSLPKEFLVPYCEIKKSMWGWAKKKFAAELKVLNKEKATKAKATKAANKKQREKAALELGLSKNASREDVELELSNRFFARQRTELERRRSRATKFAFAKGRNPKHGNEQWEARYDGRLYVLDRRDNYNLSEGRVPIEQVMDLVPGRIVLVKRI